MKRFIPTIAILLPLFFFAACGPSKSPEANASAASPAASCRNDYGVAESGNHRRRTRLLRR